MWLDYKLTERKATGRRMLAPNDHIHVACSIESLWFIDTGHALWANIALPIRQQGTVDILAVAALLSSFAGLLFSMPPSHHTMTCLITHCNLTLQYMHCCKTLGTWLSTANLIASVWVQYRKSHTAISVWETIIWNKVVQCHEYENTFMEMLSSSCYKVVPKSMMEYKSSQ